VGPRNHVLDGCPDPSREEAIVRGEGRSIVKYWDTVRSSVEKLLNQSRCRLGYGLGWAVGIVLDRGPAVLRGVAMAPTFCLSMGYNFSCIIASDTQFDSMA